MDLLDFHASFGKPLCMNVRQNNLLPVFVCWLFPFQSAVILHGCYDAKVDILKIKHSFEKRIGMEHDFYYAS